MTVKAKPSRLRHQKIGTARPMRVMANPATPNRHRTVDILFLDIQLMTHKAELLDRLDQRIASLDVTGSTHLCLIGSMSQILCCLFLPCIASAVTPFGSYDFVRIRDTVKKETEHLVSCPRRTSGEGRRNNENKQ